MAVKHALWITGGARGIAKRGGRSLVEFGPLEILIFGVDQRLMARMEREGGVGCGLGALLGHPDDPAFRRQTRRQPLDQWGKAHIGKEQPVFGVIDYIDELVIEQPRVDRVADGADPRDRVIELEMAKRVPGEGSGAVARSDP